MSAPALRVRWLVPLALAACWLCGVAAAHEEQPLLVTLTEEPGGTLLVALSVPPAAREDNWPQVDLSPACRSAAPLDSVGDAMVRLRCEGSLAGRSVTVRYPIVKPAVVTMIRAVSADGAQRVGVLRPDEATWTVPADPSAMQVVRDYLRLGVRHIWSGVDHLLFVSGLVLLAGGWRRVVLTVSGFTLAHSITLALAALQVIAVPVPPVEAAIALSIAFLARELCERRTDTLAKRFPIAVACTFGLLHGLGFASALSETGLPREHVAIGLLFFNAGVEVGQIAFVALMFALAWLVRAGTRSVTGLERWWPYIVSVHRPSLAAHALGVAAAFWFLQRTAALL